MLIELKGSFIVLESIEMVGPIVEKGKDFTFVVYTRGGHTATCVMGSFDAAEKARDSILTLLGFTPAERERISSKSKKEASNAVSTVRSER